VGGVVGSTVVSKEFEIEDSGLAPLLTWLNAQIAGSSAPAAPILSQVAGGTLTSQGTISAKVTYTTASGETIASSEASLAVNNDNELVVASPVADPAGLATGWNVYLGASGAEKKQNTAPIALGTSYTLTTAVGTTGATAPVANTTTLTKVQPVILFKHIHSLKALVTVSN
jgi:hypothetical protein